MLKVTESQGRTLKGAEIFRHLPSNLHCGTADAQPGFAVEAVIRAAA